MDSLFDEYGNLDIEELIVNRPSFMKIVEDGRVSDEEEREQALRVVHILREFERTANELQIGQMRELLAEMCVLMAAREIKRRQIASDK